MVDGLSECWRWLCGRGRRTNIFAVTTTLFLVLIAVQRQEGPGDNVSLGTADNPRQDIVRQDRDVFGDLERTEQQQEPSIIGLFLLVDLDDIDDRQWNQTLERTPLLQVHNSSWKSKLG